MKAYRLADNKTAEIAEWNYDLLPIELSELKELDFDLSMIGFTEDDLAQLLDPGVQERILEIYQFSRKIPRCCPLLLMKRYSARGNRGLLGILRK